MGVQFPPPSRLAHGEDHGTDSTLFAIPLKRSYLVYITSKMINKAKKVPKSKSIYLLNEPRHEKTGFLHITAKLICVFVFAA